MVPATLSRTGPGRPSNAHGDGLETIALAHAEQGLVELGIATRVVEPWETVVPAADGFGDP